MMKYVNPDIKSIGSESIFQASAAGQGKEF
jgi:hypothetical protein